MKTLSHLFSNCPPYLLFLGGLVSVVGLGAWKLLALVQSLQGVA